MSPGRSLCGALCRAFTNLFWEEQKPRRGAESEAERRRAAGRRVGPEAVIVQKAGYETEDSYWAASLLCFSAADVRPNRSSSLLA